jgi:hypothetical protein
VQAADDIVCGDGSTALDGPVVTARKGLPESTLPGSQFSLLFPFFSLLWRFFFPVISERQKRQSMP